MKIDDFLAGHDDIQIEAVVAPIPEDPSRIRITPVLGPACACGHALVIDKSHVLDIEPTGRMLRCCGKLRRVARVVLRSDTKVPAGDAIAGMLQRIGGDGEDEDIDPDDPRICQAEAIWQFKRCVNGCRNSSDPAACRKRCRERLAEEIEICYAGA